MQIQPSDLGTKVAQMTVREAMKMTAPEHLSNNTIGFSDPNWSDDTIVHYTDIGALRNQIRQRLKQTNDIILVYDMRDILTIPEQLLGLGKELRETYAPMDDKPANLYVSNVIRKYVQESALAESTLSTWIDHLRTKRYIGQRALTEKPLTYPIIRRSAPITTMEQALDDHIKTRVRPKELQIIGKPDTVDLKTEAIIYNDRTSLEEYFNNRISTKLQQSYELDVVNF